MAFDSGNIGMESITKSIEGSGYAIHENVFSSPKCNEIVSWLQNANHSRSRAGARHLMMNADVQLLASDPRLLSIVRPVLGSNALPFRATLFEKTGKSNWLVVWHQDTALPLEARFSSNEWGPWSTKAGINYAHAPTWALNRILALCVHLDDSMPDNGPLRVIPGSHLHGVLEDEQVFDLARNAALEECLVSRGGIVAMRPLLIHASSKARVNRPRRVLHIEYADSFELGGGIRLALC